MKHMGGFEITPSYTATLRAWDFEWSIELDWLYPPVLEGHVWGRSSLTVIPEGEKPHLFLTTRPVFSLLFSKEFLGLAEYMEADRISDGYDYFQDFEASLRVVRSELKDDGFVDLNIVFPQTAQHNVWGGVMGEARLEDCRAFAGELRTFVKAVQVSWFKKHFPGKTPSDLDEEMRRHPGSRGEFNIWLAARCSPADYAAMYQWRKAALAVGGDPPPLPDMSPYIDEAEFLGRGVLPELTFTEKRR